MVINDRPLKLPPPGYSTIVKFWPFRRKCTPVQHKWELWLVLTSYVSSQGNVIGPICQSSCELSDIRITIIYAMSVKMYFDKNTGKEAHKPSRISTSDVNSSLLSLVANYHSYLSCSPWDCLCYSDVLSLVHFLAIFFLWPPWGRGPILELLDCVKWSSPSMAHLPQGGGTKKFGKKCARLLPVTVV